MTYFHDNSSKSLPRSFTLSHSHHNICPPIVIWKLFRNYFKFFFWNVSFWLWAKSSLLNFRDGTKVQKALKCQIFKGVCVIVIPSVTFWSRRQATAFEALKNRNNIFTSMKPQSDQFLRNKLFRHLILFFWKKRDILE